MWRHARRADRRSESRPAGIDAPHVRAGRRDGGARAARRGVRRPGTRRYVPMAHDDWVELDDRRLRVRPDRLVARRARRRARRLRAPLDSRLAQGHRRARVRARAAGSARRSYGTGSPSSRAAGLRRVGLKVDAANPTGAVQLYERLGFVTERRRRSGSRACEAARPGSACCAGSAASSASPSRCASGSRPRSATTTPPRRAGSSRGSSSRQTQRRHVERLLDEWERDLRACRRTTWIPQARPDAKSSSGSTSSAQPTKCRSGSSSVLA